jgi:hypothetical protein
MTSDHMYSTGKQSEAETLESNRRCQAVTCKGLRCRNKAIYYRIYEGDRLEYLCCKTHFQLFRPHPGQSGKTPPEDD